jgi:hypothetical protein
MKRFMITICVMVILAIAINPVFSQSLEYGVKAGLNFATFGGEDAGDWGTRTGFSFGGFLAYPVAGIFFIQPELLYTMKGAEDTFTFQGDSYTESFRFSYLEIPVLGKLALPLRNMSIKPVLYAGPALSFRLSSKYHAEGGGEEYEEDDDAVKSTDFGFVIGAGAGVPIGARTLGLEVRYDFGLTSFDDSEEKYNVKNNVLMLMISLQL